MSQEPRTIQEAFATRTPNKFNPQKIKRRIDQIEIKLKNKEMTPKKGLLDINKDGEIYLKPLSAFNDYDRPVEIGYPVDPKIIDKRGVVTIWEDPDKDNKGVYFAGVDTIESEVTKTSESLLSVHIYKRSIKEITHSNGESIITYKSGRIVASYRGRFNSSQETNEMGMMLIRLYNAFAAVERNKPNFINDARRAGFTSYIARENELPFNKDVPMTDSNTPYGVYMDSANNLRQKLEDNLLDYLNRETSRDNIYDNDGNVIKTVKIWTGLDLVPDIWLLEELRSYSRDNNCDAFVSASLAISLGLSRELDYAKTIEHYEESEKVAGYTYHPEYNLPKTNKLRNKYRKTYF